jgi:hypothetical protein
MNEEWRAIPGFQGYEASDLGRVRSLERKISDIYKGKARIRLFKGKILRPAPDKRGYLLVSHLEKRVHTLVMLAFHGPPPEGMEVCHLSADRKDNRLCNLRYDNHKSNLADRLIHGTFLVGERHGSAKLTTREVQEIQNAIGTQHEIATRYGVSQSHVSTIRSGKSWAHIRREKF